MRTPHGRFFLILLLFTIAATVQAFKFPPMEGSDEPLHITYVLTLREEGRLPDRITYLENCTRQQSGQPPLTYWLAAVLLDLTNTLPIKCDEVFDYYFNQTNNRWLLTPDPLRREDNNTNFLPNTHLAAPDGLPAALYTVRMISVAFGTVAVIGAYLAAGEVFQSAAWRLTATAIFAFTPTFVHLSAYFSNDPGAAAFTTLVVWQTLAILRTGTTVQRLLFIGLLLGLGGLIKVSVLLACPAVGLAVLFSYLPYPLTPSPQAERGNESDGEVPSTLNRRVYARTGRGFRDGVMFWKVLRDAVVIIVPMILTVGIWVIYGMNTYGDPLGTATHEHPVLNYDPPLNWMTTLRGMPDVYMTYIGLLGYANVYLRPATYIVLAVVGFVAIIGLVIALRRFLAGGRGIALSLPLPLMQFVVLLVLALVTFIGFLEWYRTIFDVTGRLLMPMHMVVAIATATGLWAWFRDGWFIPTLTTGLYAVCGLFITFMALTHAYRPLLIPADDLPNIQGNVFTFDNTIRVLGYNHTTDRIQGNTHTLTVCWEVLQPTQREAAYSVRYVKDGIPIATRTTVHGLGKYNSTLWEVGATFCDTLDMPIGDPQFGGSPPEPNTRYDILVVMLDVRTLDVNWTATTSDGTTVPFPVLGQVHYVGP